MPNKSAPSDPTLTTRSRTSATRLAAPALAIALAVGVPAALVVGTSGPASACAFLVSGGARAPMCGGGGGDATFTVTAAPSTTGPDDPVTLTAAYTGTGIADDVTSSTVFSMAGGSCTANVCSSGQPGTHTVTAQYSGVNGSATKTTDVLVLAPDHLVVSPVYTTAVAGQTIAYSVARATADGTIIDDITPRATVTLGGAACPGAVCTATTAGEQVLTATFGGMTGGGAVMVAAGPAASLAVTAHVGNSWNNLQPATFTVEAYDASGNDLGDVTADSLFFVQPDGFCTGNTCYPATGGAHAVFAIDGTLRGRADLDAATPSPHVAPALPAGTVGTPYSQSVLTVPDSTARTALGSSTPPPPGLTLGADGMLSGVPTVAGTYTFDVEAANSSGAENMPTTITIAPGAPPAKPRVSIGNAWVREGNWARKTVPVTVRLSAASSTPVTVLWHTMNGTALEGKDYVAAHGRVTIPAGQLTATVPISVIGDRIKERNETFTVVLTTPRGATLGDAKATVTISNDD